RFGAGGVRWRAEGTGPGRRHPGARRFRQARLRGQGADGEVRPRARRAVLRHLLRHARRGGGFRPQRAGLKDADSSENDRNTANPVIALITEWTTATGETEQRSEHSDLGGTMRLGSQEARLKTGT